MSGRAEENRKKDIPVAMNRIDSSLSGLETQLATLLDSLYGVVATHCEEVDLPDNDNPPKRERPKVRLADDLMGILSRIDVATNKITKLLDSLEI